MGATMFASVAIYSLAWGWEFALGFVVCLWIHELGHVFIAWRQGIPVTAPVFVPGLGAYVTTGRLRSEPSLWAHGLVSLGGPVAGVLSGFACQALFVATRNPILEALAFTAFGLNLLNLLPFIVFDGARISRAIPPRIWTAGMLALGATYATGLIHERWGVLWIALTALISLRRIWAGLTRADEPQGPGAPTTKQGLIMGLAYFTLSGLLCWLFGHSHFALHSGPLGSGQ
jgi:Zn-dependent protease